MNRPTLTGRFRTRRSSRIAETALFIIALALPALAVRQVARQFVVVKVLAGPSVTIRGRTPQGTEITLTSYPALEVGR